MKKLLIISALFFTHTTHTAQAMLDLKKDQPNPKISLQFSFPNTKPGGMMRGGKMRRKSIIRRNRPAPLMPLAVDFFEKEQKEKDAARKKTAINKKLSAIQWLIHDIIEWEGPMLERDETLHNIKSYINQPLLANEYHAQMVYLENMEEKLTQKLLDAKQAIKEKYSLAEVPQARFSEDPILEEIIFKLNPEEMAIMHESNEWRKRLPAEEVLEEEITN